ncbi:MAG: FkbM family methyltransferase [Phycisphaerae bacterium]|nr:FkbM family methyltransferase [Phycisphaerae bacterium]
MVRRIASWLRTHPALGRASLALTPNLPITLNVRPIGPFRVRLGRDRRFWLRHPLEHERVPLGGLQRLIRPGDTVYDIGANLGLYSRFIVQAFGAARVIAFEPMRGNLPDLEANLRLGRIADRVRVFPVALADHEADELLQTDDLASGSAVLDSVTKGDACETRRNYKMTPLTERVHVVPLDALMERESLPPPNVLKIDVEGAEGMVLRGAAGTIERHRPRMMIELHGVSTAREVLPLLERWGYVVFCRGFSNDRAWWGRVRGADAEGEGIEHYHFHMLFAAESESVFEGGLVPFQDDGV